jgi:hypothetical protein
MKGREQSRVRTFRVTASIGLSVVLALVTVISLSAQTVYLPPALSETIDPARAELGDTVQIVVSLANPNPAEQLNVADGTWYNLHLTVVVDPALRIDTAVVGPPPDNLDIQGNTILITVNVLEPEDSYTITADCTVTSGVPAGHLVRKEATLEYTDEADNAQPTIREVSVHQVMLPMIGRNY